MGSDMTDLTRILVPALFLLFGFACSAPAPVNETQQAEMPKYGVFAFQLTAQLPGSPEQVYDLMTGDISEWWDHSFSQEPVQFYIEPKPGGGFWEYFDDQGNGVLHATVIFADRGNMLRFDGPLGLSGKAIQMVTTYTFTPNEDGGTILNVDVHAAGEMEPGIDQVVESVWRHFIFERFQPYAMEKLGGETPAQ